MPCARDVGGTIGELGARIAEVDLVDIDRGTAGWVGAVVDDGTVRTGGRDGGEALAAEVLERLTVRAELIGSLGFGHLFAGVQLLL